MKPRSMARVAAVSREETIATPRVGRIVRLAGHEVLVDFPGNTQGPLAARVSMGAGAELSEIECGGAEALLLFEDGDPAKPVVVCLLSPVGTTAGVPHFGQKNFRVTGKRLTVEGHEEVVVRSGASSLTLRRDGTVVLRGVRVKTEATETNRIRGGKVKIN